MLGSNRPNSTPCSCAFFGASAVDIPSPGERLLQEFLFLRPFLCASVVNLPKKSSRHGWKSRVSSTEQPGASTARLEKKLKHSSTGIAIGQYIPVDSVMHRLDPRTKLVGLATALVAIFVLSAPLQVLLTVVGVLTLAVWCRVGWRVWLSGTRRIVWLVLIGAATNVLFQPEGRPVIAYGIELPFTVEGLCRGLMLSVQIFLAVMVSMVFTFTTTPVQLTSAIQRFGRALGMSQSLVEDFGLVLLLAIRFVPILQWELETLVEAQKARGVDFRSGGIVSRSRSLAAILGPALTGAFRRGDLLATAMVARGFRRGAVRSEYRPLHLSGADFAALLCLGGFLLVLVVIGSVLPGV